MKKKLNVALIGTGFMGKLHSHMWRTVDKIFDVDYEVVLKCVAGEEEDVVDAFANKWGYESFSTDWRRTIERDDIDVVDIVTPTFMHKEVAVYAAKNGKNIFCEKPCCVNLAEAQ